MQAALEEWVENGQGPRQVVATKFTDDSALQGVAFSRPLCPYPAHAFYVAGDKAKAASFDCLTDDLLRPTPMPAAEYLK